MAYVVTLVRDGGTTTDSFGAADLSFSDGTFAQYSREEDGTAKLLTLLLPGEQNQLITLSYLTYGYWAQAPASGSELQSGEIVFFVGGHRTLPENMPRSGTGTYTGIVDGLALRGGEWYRLLGSTGTLSADFGAGSITSRLVLVGSQAAGQIIDLGSIDYTGTISASANAFSGLYQGGTGDFTAAHEGSLTGAFFGPAANEAGFIFDVTGEAASARGVFVGKMP
jgi:hypothetical protein